MINSLARFSVFSRRILPFPFASWQWSTGAATALATPRRADKAALVRQAVDAGWDLVRDARSVVTGDGQVLHLFGQVMNFDGQPLEGVGIEIWQSEQEVTETAFAGFGSVQTDRYGGYRFRTVMPKGDSACPPSIDARLTPPRGRVLTTRLYLLDDPRNERDWHFAALGPSRQAAVTLDPVPRTNGEMEAGFNFVL